jgi:hypothetical protein
VTGGDNPAGVCVFSRRGANNVRCSGKVVYKRLMRTALVATGSTVLMLVLMPGASAQATPEDRFDCGGITVQGTEGPITLRVLRLAAPKRLRCRRARAVARHAWLPAHRMSGDPQVLADPPGWDCRVTSRDDPDGGGICERDDPLAWGILMSNEDRHTIYVPTSHREARPYAEGSHGRKLSATEDS